MAENPTPQSENTADRPVHPVRERGQAVPPEERPPVDESELGRLLRATKAAELDAERDRQQHERRVEAEHRTTEAMMAFRESGVENPVPGVAARDMPSTLPRAFYTVSTGQIVEEIEILASTTGLHTGSYTLRALDVTADANGDKIVRRGTTISPSTTSGFGKPRAGAEACIGVSMYSVNLREGDQPIALIRGGRLRSDKMTDDGNFGVVAAGAVTNLRDMGVYLTTVDGM